MSFIKAVFADGTIEILNLTHIKSIEIEEDSIDLIAMDEDEYCYSDNLKSRFYITNFKEVKEKLLKLCDDWYGNKK